MDEINFISLSLSLNDQTSNFIASKSQNRIADTIESEWTELNCDGKWLLDDVSNTEFIVMIVLCCVALSHCFIKIQVAGTFARDLKSGHSGTAKFTVFDH